MKTFQPTQPDDTVLAAISHFFGPLVAIIIWSVQKDKSEYVRFQAIQAVAFSILLSLVGILVTGLCFICIFGVMVIGMVGLASDLAQSPDAFLPFAIIPVFMPLIISCLIIPFSLVIWLARLIAVIRVLQGKDFRYPWLGNQVEKFLYAES